MKPTLLPRLALLLSLFACTKQQSETGQVNSGPKIVEAKGYVVPADSMAVPKVFQIDERKLTKVSSGISVIYQINTNVRLAGKPKTITAGKPQINTPGQDTFQLPEHLTVSISVSTIKAPEIIKSKDPSFGSINTGHFSTYSKMQGLSHNQVYSLLEDQYGNIYFGTEGAGVTKFDGNSFTNFTVENGLSHNNVMSMVEDKNDNIWLGHYDGLIDKYDGQKITQYQLPKEKRATIRCMAEDNDGNIWFGTTTGVIKYDGDRFLCYSTKQGLLLTSISGMAKDKNGNLWFAGHKGGVAKFDGNSFTLYRNKEGLLTDYVQSILGDKQGNLWIGHESGVSKFDGSIFTHYTVNEGLPQDFIIGISEDHLGHLWFCTQNNGVLKFDHSSFFHYTTHDGLADNKVRSILIDKMQNVWIGTNGGGVSKFNANNFTHYNTISDLELNNIRGSTIDSAGNLWFCHGKEGILKFNGSSFEHITDSDLSTEFKYSTILSDVENAIWVSGDDGVSKYHQGKFTHFYKKDFSALSTIRDKIEESYNPLSNIRAMTTDAKGNVWFCSWGQGVSVFDGEKLIQFRTENGLSTNYNNSIHCDKNGNIWIGSWDEGITKLVPIQLNTSIQYGCTHYSEKEGLSQKSVYAIMDDHYGNLWFGTWGGGVSRFDGTHFTHITTKEGLINNFVYSLLEDQNANIWIGTRLGLGQLNISIRNAWFAENNSTSSKTLDLGIANYTYEDGFLGIGFRMKGLLEDRNGKLWAVTDNMITTFPSKDKIESTDSIAPTIQLTALQLFNEKIDWLILKNKMDTSFKLGNGVKIGKFQFSGLSKWYALPENLSLASNNNYLTFRYIGITQKKANKVKYKYLLEGNDENWSALTSLTEAHYGNLPHGRYTFKVKAMNSEGFWSDEFHYPFTIRPPWWLTWWAYSLYAVGIITLLWRLHKFQQARTIRIERERTQAKELEQARQIEKAYAELKATQKQLIQSEKMASLGELTAGIAHEIQNPLNFVNNFSDVNKELLTEMQIEIDKENLDEVKSIAKDVIANEEKINHHGRRADAIVKGMLQHSRSSSGTKEPTDINALADEYLRLAYHGLRAKDKTFNATMKTAFDDTIGMINVIPQDIGRMILNLITNAFYAVSEKQKNLQTSTGNQTPYPLQGGVEYEPTVTVMTKLQLPLPGGRGAEKSGGGIVVISVRDNGPGIPQHVLDKIFQPFFTTKPTGQGTGLGLSLSYDIVKAHGGELKVQTKEGEFAEFIITLPI